MSTRSRLFIILAIIALVAVSCWFWLKPNHLITDYQTTQYSLNGKTFKLLVADTAQKQQQGLMHIRSLPNADGMIFYFDDKRKRLFWNKNTHFDLQLYWIADQQIIGTAYLPSIARTIETVKVFSPAPADTVIEVILQNEGTNDNS
ncbi:MAG: hypothetical protein CMF50_04500 [Legionellales bacterium]|nr:hypothetical protein [Legionellales bacterium]|tara:strand:- start:10279 stop:10716 length:438 start_codon:yes stop_codon:yes gene_type:complete